MAKTFIAPDEREEFEEFKRSRGFLSERSVALAEQEFRRSKEGGPQPTGDIPREFRRTPEFGPSVQGDEIAITTKRGPAIERHPVTDPKLYSPFDQKQLDKLYTQRSKIATDATLDETARQRGLDIIDANIGRVPMLTPSRREPTAQQKFDAGIVTTPDGIRGRLDKNDKFVPFEGNKIETQRRADYRASFSTTLKGLLKTNETRSGDEVRTTQDMVQEASVIAGMEHGFDLQPDFAKAMTIPMAPKLTPAWGAAMFNLDRAGAGKESVISKIRGVVAKTKRATEEQMRTEMAAFINEAVGKGISSSVASVDFLNRWKDEADRDILGLVPKFPTSLDRKLSLGKLLTANPADLRQPGAVGQQPAIQPQGRPSVEGAFSVEGDTIRFQTVTGGSKTATAKGFGAMWAQLRSVHQRNLVSKLNQGFTAAQLVKVFQDNPEEFK